MTNHKFKTNINCAGCIAKATTTLNSIAGKGNWIVDITNPNKIMTISNDKINTDELIKSMQHIGFKIDPLFDQ